MSARARPGVHALGQVRDRAAQNSKPLVNRHSWSRSSRAASRRRRTNREPFPGGCRRRYQRTFRLAIAVLASRPQNDGSQIDLYGAYLVRAKFSRRGIAAGRVPSAAANFDAAILHGGSISRSRPEQRQFGGSHMGRLTGACPHLDRGERRRSKLSRTA